MHSISWLQISDLHMRVSEAWSHDVVLKALCEDIERKRREGTASDFILVTGDLAFSGSSKEYKLVKGFFDGLIAASGVPSERIFCIPGNHDIQRDRQKMCFRGSRGFIQSQNQIDILLSPGDDLRTLLDRQKNYRRFQGAFFTAQKRAWTDDGLGYVSCVTIDSVNVAIVGLDSAWLAEGGLGDHGKLLVGERQVINALNLAKQFDPHITIAMAHHPFHLLLELDRRPVQGRIENECHFFHCGHLHEPEVRAAGIGGSHCLTLAAGASFETRLSRNSYSFVTLDLLAGERTVTTMQYNPIVSAFTFTASEQYPIEVFPSGRCSLNELAQAIMAFRPSLSPWAHYLAALLLDQKSELPIPTQNGHVFGSFAVLMDQPDGELRQRTIEFMQVRNVLRLFYKREPLADILSRHGDAIERYGAALAEACRTNPELTARLAQQEKDVKAIAVADDHTPQSYTATLLSELAESGEWDQLREHAERHLNSPDERVARDAKRMLALSLAHSEVSADKRAACEQYRALISTDPSEPTDLGNLATLLIDSGDFEGAKGIVLDGISGFPSRQSYFVSIGLRIVEATGDKLFRDKLKQR